MTKMIVMNMGAFFYDWMIADDNENPRHWSWENLILKEDVVKIDVFRRILLNDHLIYELLRNCLEFICLRNNWEDSKVYMLNHCNSEK